MTATPPCPAPHEISAWHAHIDHVWPSAASHDRGLTWLTSAERARYDGFRHDADRQMFLLGRVMARTLVGRALSLPAAAWPWREGPRGRPEIDIPETSLSFNLAHSGGIVVCALARDAEVGIDIEDRRRPQLDRGLVERYCSPAEGRNVAAQPGDGWRDQFLKYWTLKEAYLKARGLGIAVHLSDLSFTVPPAGHVAVEFLGSLVGTDPGWAFDLRLLGNAHFVAVAASTPRDIRPTFSLDPLPPTGYLDAQPDEPGGELMKLLAIADLHLGHRINREALPTIPAHPEDWLIVAGDVGEQPAHLELALTVLTSRFARVIWTPGNHDLWCAHDATDRTRGQERYEELVAICRRFGVLTPEDPYVAWPLEPDTFIVPMFLLFDYTFRPADVGDGDAIAWARAAGAVSGDELMIDPRGWPSLTAWCHARCDATSARLVELPVGARTILINHWPLRYDLARPPRVPRFSLWCGTTRTEDWARRFRARAVISGHLHFRTTLWRHGVRYDEVSLGYPRDWRRDRGPAWYLRQVLPEGGVDRDRFVPARDPFLDRLPLPRNVIV